VFAPIIGNQIACERRNRLRCRENFRVWRAKRTVDGKRENLGDSGLPVFGHTEGRSLALGAQAK
jgi:hypothetical protein